MIEKPWWRSILRRQSPESSNQTTADSRRPDLREFIYLDEVSLMNLLSSQKGEVTDSTSEQASEGRDTAIAATAGANPGILAKAEITSRYQTTNSSTIQTSRKATVQSRFRELHQIDGLRIIEPVLIKAPATDIATLKATDTLSQLSAVDELQRGKLIEMRVCLAADPIFRLGTMVSEFTIMSEEYPDMFEKAGGLAALEEMQPVNKVLQRLLAGLVPVRAVAVDYVVVDIEGVEYVSHKKMIEGLDLETRPLEIVGVTEQEAYWKDLRRVLFSEAEFTILARISRSGLHNTWTPVKLADLFAEVAPGLVEQINAAGRVPIGDTSPIPSETVAETKLAAALSFYVKTLLQEVDQSLDSAQQDRVEQRITELKARAATVTDQTSAFSLVSELVLGMVGCKVDPARAFQLRTVARQEAGLSLFPSTESVSQPSTAKPKPLGKNAPRLLDVEFVAIYW